MPSGPDLDVMGTLTEGESIKEMRPGNCGKMGWHGDGVNRRSEVAYRPTDAPMGSGKLARDGDAAIAPTKKLGASPRDSAALPRKR